MNLKNIKNYFIIILIFITLCNVYAQEERRTSFSVFGGVAFFPKDLKNPASLTTKALGGFNPTAVMGLGIYFKLSPKFKLGENYMFMPYTRGQNRKLTNQAFRTTLKYSLFKDKKFTPYLVGSININRATLDRDENEYSFVPDSSNSSSIIGAGIKVDSIYYREKALKLSGLPIFGASLGAGFEFKLNKRMNVFAEYNIHANLGKSNKLIEQYYFSNESNFTFHTVTAGLNIKIFQPQKQLLAKLEEDDWRNSKSIDVKGVIVYKNPKKPANKVLPVEQTDTSGVLLLGTPTDENGLVFFSKNIKPGDYQFMLPKKNRKILRADLQILNYNHIEIMDDDLELDMVENEGSENILSRDANFAVLLREGFQHEIELTTTAENIMGNMNVTNPDCRVRIILKDQYDSIIAYIDTLDNNTFNFVDLVPGNYRLTFKKVTKDCKETQFYYKFTGAAPYVNRQYNADEPKEIPVTYNINGTISTSLNKLDAPKGSIAKLVSPTGRVEKITPLSGDEASFNFGNLESPQYNVIYDDPSNKAGMDYVVNNNKSEKIREVHTGLPSKPLPGDNYLVKGKIAGVTPDQAKSTKVLLIDSTGKIKETLPIMDDGSFIFDNLGKNKYKVAYETTDPKINGNINFKTIDKNLKVTRVQLPELKAIIQKTDTIAYFRIDTANVNNTAKPQVVATNSQPTTVVEKPINNNNSAVTKAADTTSTKTTTPVIVKTEEPGIKEPVKKDPQPTKTTTKSGKEEPIKYPYNDFQPNKTYDFEGYEVNPEGYGVQVASFIINSNLEKFCQRLRDKGEKKIFIQVIEKDKNDPSAGLIYRVILDANDDKEKMIKRIPGIMDKGYNAVLRKHL